LEVALEVGGEAVVVALEEQADIENRLEHLQDLIQFLPLQEIQQLQLQHQIIP
tara:strand:- start:492 stop:650 length:159 start_codon:yes stop_codon:yes gene_type:complete